MKKVKFIRAEIAYRKEILELGATLGDFQDDSGIEHYAAFMNEKLIGYFWGQIGKGDYYIDNQLPDKALEFYVRAMNVMKEKDGEADVTQIQKKISKIINIGG